MAIDIGTLAMNKDHSKTCGSCGCFISCFNKSNELIGIDSTKITEKMMTDAMNILACEDYK